MPIRVRLFGEFREAAGREVEVEAGMIRELLEKLSENPRLRNALFENWEERRLKKYVNILVNGRRVEEDEALKEGDTVAIFSPVAGG
jgi:molybdopterin synthase sulfur carrier subunit